MRKKTIAWLFVIGIILGVIGSVLYVPAYLSAISATQSALQSGSTVTIPTIGATAYLGAALAGIGSILTFISWIGALVATGKQNRWGWFVLVFLLNGLGELIYLIGGPAL